MFEVKSQWAELERTRADSKRKTCFSDTATLLKKYYCETRYTLRAKLGSCKTGFDLPLRSAAPSLQEVTLLSGLP